MEQKYSQPLHATETGVNSGSYESSRLQGFILYIQTVVIFQAGIEWLNSMCDHPPSEHTPGDMTFFLQFVVYSPPPGTRKGKISHPRDSAPTANTSFVQKISKQQYLFSHKSEARHSDNNIRVFLEFIERRILHV